MWLKYKKFDQDKMLLRNKKMWLKYKECDNDIEIWNLWVEYKNSLGYKKYKLNIKYEEYL